MNALLVTLLLATADAGFNKVAEDRAAQMMQLLRREHTGPGPCYRWDRQSAIAPITIAATAESLHQKGVTSKELAPVVPLFIEWANALESKAHKLSERDELAKVVTSLAGPGEREKLAKNPKAMDELADKIVTQPVDTKKAKEAFDKLPKKTKEAIKDEFKRNGPVMRLSFVDLIVAMQEIENPKKPDVDEGHGH